MNWKIGKKLVCIDTNWVHGYSPIKIGDVVTTASTPYLFDGEWAVWIKEDMNCPCYAWHFRPLLGESAKSELINSFKEITETSDMPIREPNPSLV